MFNNYNNNPVSMFSNMYCKANIYTYNNQDITVKGSIKEHVKDNTVFYIAAAPPDYRATFTGSGLPFANQDQAFYATPNSGKVLLNDNSFEIKLMYPNSYYVGLGTVVIQPTVYVYYIPSSGDSTTPKVISIPVSEGIPYRMLSYPMQFTKPRENAMFYDNVYKLPVRTQEQILRSAAYPSENKMADNFWGLKPSV